MRPQLVTAAAVAVLLLGALLRRRALRRGRPGTSMSGAEDEGRLLFAEVAAAMDAVWAQGPGPPSDERYLAALWEGLLSALVAGGDSDELEAPRGAEDLAEWRTVYQQPWTGLRPNQTQWVGRVERGQLSGDVGRWGIYPSFDWPAREGKFRRMLGGGGPKVPPALMLEYHHHQGAEWWALGRQHHDALVRLGLRPWHRLLDVGCGALRAGLWAIPLLRPGGYVCIEAEAGFADAAQRYEIPLWKLEHMRPRVLHASGLNLSSPAALLAAAEPSELLFDWVLLQRAPAALGAVLPLLHPRARVLAAGPPAAAAAAALTAGGAGALQPLAEHPDSCFLGACPSKLHSQPSAQYYQLYRRSGALLPGWPAGDALAAALAAAADDTRAGGMVVPRLQAAQSLHSRWRWLAARAPPPGLTAAAGPAAPPSAAAALPRPPSTWDARKQQLAAAATGAGAAPPALLLELHHHYYGSAWADGRKVFELLREAGLQPGHRLLDVACGSMRVGVWAAAYLAAGNYYCIDQDEPSVRAGLEYEVPLHGLVAKRPSVLLNSQFQVDRFPGSPLFDFVLLCAVEIHLSWYGTDGVMWLNVARQMQRGGQLLTTHRMPRVLTLHGPDAFRRAYGLRHVRSRRDPCLLGHCADQQGDEPFYHFFARDDSAALRPLPSPAAQPSPQRPRPRRRRR
eukprot:TRINITY_DN28021_c0_g1_i1.p1 TRINITY_DN28021_c0_g1~~TRINITY_DN28021_c0_g1_i1.p1  ORF type:complete len:680 (+),score=179.44 TRINITY_DN28021_c0_g1_i1:109-2148(+)